MTQRRYSEQEVADILQRVSELESRSPPEEAGALTLREIERVASEAGFRSDLVQRAVRELEVGRGDLQAAGSTTGLSWARWLGAPSRLRYERHLPVGLSDAVFELAVGALRRQVGERGYAEPGPESCHWYTMPNAAGGGRSISLELGAGDGGTVVRLEERLGHLVGGIFGGLWGGLGGGGLGAVIPFTLLWLSPSALVLTVSLWLVCTYWLTRRVYAWAVRARAGQLEAGLSELERAVADMGAP